MTQQWEYEYLPYTSLQTGKEIPHFRISPVDDVYYPHYIAETNENLPVDVQEHHARLISAAPDMLEALKAQEMADYDPEASRRKGYFERARQLRKAALAKVEGK